MLFIGVDPSLTGTGLFGIDEHAKKVFEAHLDAGEVLRGPERLEHLREAFEREVIFRNPDGVAMEGYSFGSKNNRAHSLGELGGLFRWSLYMARVRTIIVPPQTLKQYVTGSGATKKEMMPKEVFKRLGYDCLNGDTADAAGLSHMALTRFLPLVPGYTYRVAAMAKCEVLPQLVRKRINNLQQGAKAR